MQELERLGVRVVSGRLGRKAGDEEDGPSSKKSSSKSTRPGLIFFSSTPFLE